LFEALADQIEERILSGQLEPGAKLPSESSVAHQYAVSRPVVREALARLRARGLIETINGSGTYVRQPDPAFLADVLARHLRFAAVPSEWVGRLYEARETIEVSTTRLAAARGSEADFLHVAEQLEAMRASRDDQWRWTAADLGFHLMIASASHNLFLSTLLTPLVKVIERGIRESHRSSEAVNAGLRAHEEILESLRARDEDAAGEAMRRHLHDSKQRFASAFGAEVSE